MADIEKVIQGIEVCLQDDGCTPCPYYRRGNDYFCGVTDIMRDALELLKEQEAVKPVKEKGFNPPLYVQFQYVCNKCKADLIKSQPFCSGCGRPVKWE